MVRLPFHKRLADNGLTLARAGTTTLQINVGLICDLECRHCHLEAGPSRMEMMGPETVREVVDFARRFRFATVDITGGAPELNPHLSTLISGLAPLTGHLIVRTNLTALSRPGYQGLINVYQKYGVALVASLPSINRVQADAQRGSGVWDICLKMLRLLNSTGFGREGSGLVLDLVSNPTGAFLPAGQTEAEKRFRSELASRHGIQFNRLYAFGNAPLGRFRQWLEESGNLESYMNKLAEHFNPCVTSGLMCRSMLSVDWRGVVYDCDFNQAAGLPLGGCDLNVSSMSALPLPGTAIAVGEHCYVCTAGSGFT